MKKVILASLMSACVVVGLSSFTVKHSTAIAKRMVDDTRKDIGTADDTRKDIGTADDTRKDIGTADAHRRSVVNDRRVIGTAD